MGWERRRDSDQKEEAVLLMEWDRRDSDHGEEAVLLMEDDGRDREMVTEQRRRLCC